MTTNLGYFYIDCFTFQYTWKLKILLCSQISTGVFICYKNFFSFNVPSDLQSMIIRPTNVYFRPKNAYPTYKSVNPTYKSVNPPYN